MKTAQATHGGRRPNSGRPPVRVPRTRTTITLPVDVKQWMDRQPEATSKLVLRALLETYNLKEI